MRQGPAQNYNRVRHGTTCSKHWRNNINSHHIASSTKNSSSAIPKLILRIVLEANHNEHGKSQ